MHQNNRKGLIDLIESVMKLTGSSFLYVPIVSLSITHHFFVANLNYSLLESFNRFTIFWVSIYIMGRVFCKNSKFVSSVLSIIKKIVASSYLSSLPMKLIYCIVSAFLNRTCLLKSVATNLQCLEK